MNQRSPLTPYLISFRRNSVKRRIAVAATLAATLIGAAACGSNSDSSDTPNAAASVNGAGKTIKVWLMVDAQSGWPEVVKQANDRFTQATGAQVQVDYQQWTDHLAKLDTTLAGSDVPDVVELGNTEMPKYVFNGAFAPLDKGQFENSAEWLTGLSAPCELDGKTYCVPYYAGARVLIYRTDLFDKAGLKAPKTYDDLVAAAKTLKEKNGSDKQFSAFYMPGKYWYAAMAWVHGNGGTIAKKDGDKWVGTLSEPGAQQGLTKWAEIAKTYSSGDPTKDENDQDAVYAQGKSGMIYGNGWELGAVQEQPKDPNDPASAKVKTKVNGKVATAPLPGIPSFLGGSDVAVTAKSKNADLAAKWAQIFTDAKSQEGLIAKGVLPNATSLLDKAAAVKGNEATAQAAKETWFVPMAPKWSDVESANVLQNMLVSIATGKATVPDAAKAADAKINEILNAS
ncbi:sugar ABC transporter substrate-binding protein [Amorphoplanes nipponensis]|uniref:Sugar ABC transporter substrate-binding protein n=1 Tax=Actinoplanes nipponensis TaxID=135950 RepID=A0A919MIU4_9ACTN|nr:sugar ABC transporter substrate-binding protein [Actinoplanes nipponensis]